jgi:protein TonB
MVATRLAQSKRYPERALRKNVNGDGAIRIQISSNGDVSHFEIVQSTSSTILDEELKDMVERASPFPPFPPDMRRDTLAVIVPVSFRLERSL